MESADSRIRSMESSVRYLQEQHAETLRSLHQEISHLQKKCSELTFRLTMGKLDESQDAGGGGRKSLAPLERVRSVEEELRRAKAAKEKEVEELQAKNSALEVKYRALEGKYRQLEVEVERLRERPDSTEAGGSRGAGEHAAFVPLSIRRSQPRAGGGQRPAVPLAAGDFLQASALAPRAPRALPPIERRRVSNRKEAEVLERIDLSAAGLPQLPDGGDAAGQSAL